MKMKHVYNDAGVIDMINKSNNGQYLVMIYVEGGIVEIVNVNIGVRWILWMMIL